METQLAGATPRVSASVEEIWSSDFLKRLPANLPIPPLPHLHPSLPEISGP